MKRIDDQMPGWLGKFDDPWGLTWRVKNVVTRFQLKSVLRFIRAFVKPIRHESPIFVAGVSRSGTSMLFHWLRASAELGSLATESNDIWRTFHHPRYHNWRSDFVYAGESVWGERRYVDALYTIVSGLKRFVDKTPDHSVRLPYLLDLYPDAYFVVVKRNPCDVINSLINGWRHPAGLFRNYYVPERLSIPGYPYSNRWCFSLAKDWRQYKSATVAELAFLHWQQWSEALEDYKSLVVPERWIEIHLEHFLAAPDATADAICRALGISNSSALQTKLRALIDKPVNALSEAVDEKWRQENELEVRSLLPAIAEHALRTGYQIDKCDGSYRIINAPFAERFAERYAGRFAEKTLTKPARAN